MSHPIDFTNLNYLQSGSVTQRAVYSILRIFLDRLAAYQPILTGTVPIGIDTSSSDLDVICCCHDLEEFSETLRDNFGQENRFALVHELAGDLPCVRANFYVDSWEIEVFGQDLPTTRQNAYLHMVIEHAVLREKGERFRRDIVRLKQRGVKTEPAFVQLLELDPEGTCNPFVKLLTYGRSRGFIE